MIKNYGPVGADYILTTCFKSFPFKHIAQDNISNVKNSNAEHSYVHNACQNARILYERHWF